LTKTSLIFIQFKSNSPSTSTGNSPSNENAMLIASQASMSSATHHHYHHFGANGGASVPSTFANPFGTPNSFSLAHHQTGPDPHHDFLLRTSVSHW